MAIGSFFRLSVLFTLSGAAALIYQVLWTRELALLFGSTAQAAALTIAIFFTGIALGGWLFGRQAAKIRRPLHVFGIVEIGVAATALGHFLIADLYFAFYPALVAVFGGSLLLDTVFKAVVAATILLPSAVLMGGTLPLMGQHLIRSSEDLGKLGSALYAFNTVGGAIGAFSAGFFLPVLLGFSGAYLLAVTLDLIVGLMALTLAKGALPQITVKPLASARTSPRIWLIAFVSGFATLAVEVLWVRAFAQVLQNSVYTYSLVLTAFLVALSLGAVIANALGRRAWQPELVLRGLLFASMAAVAATPHLFYYLTGGLAYLGAQTDFWGYTLEVTRVSLIVVVLPGAVLGAVLPYLLRLMQGHGQPGAILGRLIALNTLGAIAGTLVGGFVLLPLVGAWKGLWLMAAAYALLILLVPSKSMDWRSSVSGAAAVLASLFLLAASPGVQSTRLAPGETLLAFKEGHAAHVAVVQRDDAKFIRVNNFYTLGGSGALVPERNQTMIPLLLHPNPEEVFFLGLGTGISAGAVLYAEPQRVTVCELLGDVIEFSRDWFEPYTNGLFDDPRVTIHAEDGRQCLARSKATYDLIIADLFTPWRAGVSNTYSLEHYQLAASRLKPGGAYVQWLPLYQVSRTEFEIIANTMAQVFPSLVLWRGDLYPEASIVALVGSNERQTLDVQTLASQWRTMTGSNQSDDVLIDLALKFYAGNAHAGLFADAPINTDSRPLIEYMAPRTHRAVIAGLDTWLVGQARDQLYDELLLALPPAQDPYLKYLSDAQLDMIYAGQVYAQWQGVRARRALGARALWQRFTSLAPEHAHEPDSPAGYVGRSQRAFGQ